MARNIKAGPLWVPLIVAALSLRVFYSSVDLMMAPGEVVQPLMFA